MEVPKTQHQKIYSSIIDQINESSDLLLFYCKKSCRQCLGKGYILHGPVGPTIKKKEQGKTITLTEPPVYRQLCKCVLKNVEKEVEGILDK